MTNLKNIFQLLFQSAENILFPRRCPVCGEIVMPKGGLICPECMGKLSWIRGAVCMKCGRPLTDEVAEYCLDCMRHKRSFDRGFALLEYDDVSSRSMAQIKYNNKREYLDFYSEAVVRAMGKRLEKLGADALIPVPIHPSRKRARGFNQAEELARRLSEKLDIPMEAGILRRDKKTLPQKDLGPEERLKNLRKAFTASTLPAGMERVILVDDIYTTGSTAEACARALKAAGAKKVYVLALCIGHGA